MRSFCRKGQVAVLFSLAFTLLVVTGARRQERPEKERKPDDKLTHQESKTIRDIVFAGLRVGTTVPKNGAIVGYRIVVVPAEIKKLHNEKRIATLSLLLDIIRGGRQGDCLSAAGYAMALEGDPMTALWCCIMHTGPGAVDETSDLKPQPFREKTADWLQFTINFYGGKAKSP
ncbi:MAG: hypothetical protein HY040_12365 [Planctomycetes bacterium]|nr:hypothetical protein [Planctomycetota bacterium]